MTDFEFECAQKKNIARSAAHRKRGSRSKRCSLPSDHLTKKELKAMNGEVVTYKIDGPLKWVEFLKLPVDLKKQYLETLVEKYEANGRQIAEMLGVTPGTLSKALRDIPGFGFYTRKRQSKNQKDIWQAFLDGASVEKTSEPEEQEADAVKESIGGLYDDAHEDVCKEPEARQENTDENKKDTKKYDPENYKRTAPYRFRIELECENLYSVSGLVSVLQSLDGVTIQHVGMDWRPANNEWVYSF